MAWGSKQDATQLTSIGTTEQFFSLTPTQNPRELLNCEVTYNAPATPTDALEVNLYRTLDDTSEDWDDTPFMKPALIANTPDPNKISFDVMGTYKFRIGVKMDGSTDTTGTADFSFRKDGVDA